MQKFNIHEYIKECPYCRSKDIKIKDEIVKQQPIDNPLRVRLRTLLIFSCNNCGHEICRKFRDDIEKTITDNKDYL